MLAWFREWSRSFASAALVSLVTLTISSAVPHDDCHDADCGLITPHDPSGHGVGRPQQGSDSPLHCVLCHWTRLVRPTPETTHVFVPAVGASVFVATLGFSALSEFQTAQPSLRAPPRLG